MAALLSLERPSMADQWLSGSLLCSWLWMSSTEVVRSHRLNHMEEALHELTRAGSKRTVSRSTLPTVRHLALQPQMALRCS